MSSLREAAVTFFQTPDRLGIIYAVGGSFASSLHGVARAAQDIDAKLLWYQEGGNVSERQWDDLLNLVLVQGDRLDRQYLGAQANRLGVGHLLARLPS